MGRSATETDPAIPTSGKASHVTWGMLALLGTAVVAAVSFTLSSRGYVDDQVRSHLHDSKHVTPDEWNGLRDELREHRQILGVVRDQLAELRSDVRTARISPALPTPSARARSMAGAR